MHKSLVHLVWVVALVGEAIFSAIAPAGEHVPPPSTTPSTAAAQAVRYPVRFKRDSTAVQTVGWMQIPTRYEQIDDKPIAMEAESSTRIVLTTTDGVPVATSACSNGLCIEHVSELENQFLLNQAGTYQTWYRAWFPRPGDWNHVEQMDDGEPITVTDSKNGDDQKWLWVKGPQYALSRGWHRYLWPAPTAWRGGTRIDKIALVLLGEPPPVDLGPETSHISLADSATLETNRFRLDDFQAWQLSYDEQDNGGQVVVNFSDDRGKTWNLLRKDVRPTPGPDEKRVSFRIELRRSSDGVSPRIRNLTFIGYPRAPDGAP